MATCANCGQVILFGGIKHGTMRFCNQKCYDVSASFLNLADELPEEIVEQSLTELHQGDCPRCGGPGPVDIHFSYRMISFVAITWFQTIPVVSCTSCARKPKAGNFLITFFLGWWGGVGLFMTPIYLCCNLYALVFPVSKKAPSPRFREYIRHNLAHTMMSRAASDANNAAGGKSRPEVSEHSLQIAPDDNNPYSYRDYDESAW